MAEVPHLAFPLRMNPDGTLADVEQDTIDDVRQCVHVLLRTEVGSRPLAPDVGIEDPTFTEGLDPVQVATRLEEMEDRAQVTITIEAPHTGEQRAQVNVELADQGVEEDADIS